MKIKNENSGTEYCQTTLNVDDQKIWTSEYYQWKNSTDHFNLNQPVNESLKRIFTENDNFPIACI